MKSISHFRSLLIDKTIVCTLIGKRADISSTRLYHNKNRYSKKLMVSACVTWNGYMRPFFVDPSHQKVNAEYYRRHLKKELFHTCQKFFRHEKYYFMQDGATSHTAAVTQNDLSEKFGRRFIQKEQWPPTPHIVQ